MRPAPRLERSRRLRRLLGVSRGLQGQRPVDPHTSPEFRPLERGLLVAVRPRCAAIESKQAHCKIQNRPLGVETASTFWTQKKRPRPLTNGRGPTQEPRRQTVLGMESGAPIRLSRPAFVGKRQPNRKRLGRLIAPGYPQDSQRFPDASQRAFIFVINSIWHFQKVLSY